MSQDFYEATDSLDGESRDGTESADGGTEPDEVEFPAPDEILARQRVRYAERFRRRADAPPVQRRKRGEPFTPSPEWTQAFRTQCTREARNKVRTFAYLMSAWLENSGLPAGDTWVDEQVQRAIADTLDGRIRWRVDRNILLVPHLKDTIRARAWKIIERSKKYREVSLDHGHDDDHIEADLDEKPTEIEASLESRRGQNERDELAGHQMRAKIIAALRAEAEKEGEHEEVRMLDALALLITDKVDVCAHANLTPDQYHNAKRRIMRRATKLSEELRSNAMEALTREDD
jgi:hypothetical protein